MADYVRSAAIAILVALSCAHAAAQRVRDLPPDRGPAGSGAVSEAQALAFFARYVALGEAYDAALADLYADSSRISFNRIYPAPLPPRSAEVNGDQWRAMIRSAMPLAKAKGDRSEYSNVRAELHGDRVMIRADRYPVLKCAWDRGFYMVVARDAAGGLFIAEEHFDTQATSSC